MDFLNAFNSIDRERMFEEDRAHIPFMAPWIEWCYGSKPLLHLGDHIIHSCCRVQQGDLQGLLGFALTLHPIVEKIGREVPNLLINVWYLDDGTLCGSPDDLCAALAIIKAEGPSRGLYLNRFKFLLYIPREVPLEHNPLPSAIPIARDSFGLLGSPIGPASYCQVSVMR